MHRLIQIAFCAAALLGTSNLSWAVEPDLSGWWGAGQTNGEVVGELHLKQDGARVSAQQKMPELAKEFGPEMFKGEIHGRVLKGKVITFVPGKKETCGKNWASWTDLELTLSADGNRLEGRWLQEKSTISAAGCSVTGTQWVPWALTRAVAPPAATTKALPVALAGVPSGPTTKDKLIGGAGFLILLAVAFFVRVAYVNFLVSSYKRSPDKAGLAGWMLFGAVVCAAALAAIALISASYLSTGVVAGLSALAALSLLATALVSSGK